MTFKQALIFLLGLEVNTFVLIAGFALLCVLLGLICIWVVALLYSGLTFGQYLNFLVR